MRSERSLIQTIGRAARNSNGKVIMYGDNITGSMSRAIEETNRRRKIQKKFNEENGIIQQLSKRNKRANSFKETHEMAIKYMSKKIKKQSRAETEQLLVRLDKEMREAARILDFERAAQLRRYDIRNQRRIRVKN